MPAPWTADERRRWLLLSVALVSLPFILPTFLPLTDLPQHLAQVRLLDELWNQRPATIDLSVFETRPWAANTFVYWPLFVLCHLLPPLLAGKVLVWLMAVGITVALQHLAAVQERDPAHALLAAIFTFSAPFYWGFLNFLSGWPFWIWFLARALQSRNREQPSWRADAGDALLVLVLYWAHVFWMVAAAIATALFELEAVDFARLLRRRDASERAAGDLKRLVRRALIFVPVIAPALVWYPRMARGRAAAGFDLAAHWGYWSGPLAGVRGPIEPAIEIFIAGYVVFSLWRAPSPRARAADTSLLRLGEILLAWVALAPSKYMNTLQFNTRFLHPAAMLILLSLPRTANRWQARLGAVAVAAFMLATAGVWLEFDRVECSGLAESLRAGTGCHRSLGLNVKPNISLLESRPFIHSVAYLQVLYGGETNFSFAELDSSIVVYREPRQRPWTAGLEWFALNVQPSDLAYFDCALVDHEESLPKSFGTFSHWETPIASGNFRLYRRPASRSESPP